MNFLATSAVRRFQLLLFLNNEKEKLFACYFLSNYDGQRTRVCKILL